MATEIVIPEAALKQEAKDEAKLAKAKADQAKRLKKQEELDLDETPVKKPDVDPAVEPEPIKEPSPEPTSTEEKLIDLKRALAAANQRNSTLQGMIKSQKPGVEELQELRDKIKELEGKVSKPEKNAPAYQKYLQDDEQRIYNDGSVEVKMAKGITEEAIAKGNEESNRKMEELDKRIAQAESRTVEEKRNSETSILWNAIDEELPGAREIDNDPLFIDWLNKPDPQSISGATYGQRGSRLLDHGNVKGVASLMREFLAEEPNANPKVTRQVKPSRSKGSEVKTPEKPPVVTKDEIKRFYNDQAMGKLKNPDGSPMSEEEADKIEKIIEKAAADGRVVS